MPFALPTLRNQQVTGDVKRQRDEPRSDSAVARRRDGYNHLDVRVYLLQIHMGITCADLAWNGPFLLGELADSKFADIPEAPGVYVFSETPNRLQPNPALPAHQSPRRRGVVELLRNSPDCVLYIGKADSLRSRIPGYLHDPGRSTSKHKGRALLHAYQYEAEHLYVWWAQTPRAAAAEKSLIRELHPILNTNLRVDPQGNPLSRSDHSGPQHRR